MRVLPLVLCIALASAASAQAQELDAETATETADPPAEPSAPPRGKRSVKVDVDLVQDERYSICIKQLRERRDVEARACLERVIEEAPGTTAAVRARAVLAALPPTPSLGSEVRPQSPVPFRPGHLELTIAAGAFGIWNGAAGAIALGQSPLLVPEYVSLAGGAAAVGLGGVYAVTSYLVADRLELSPGRARLLSSGLVWGTGLGLSLAPWAFALAGSPWPEGALPPLDQDFERALPFALIPTLLGGYVGAGGAALVAAFFDVDAAQVGTMNTGGWIGFALGFATTPLVDAAGFGDPIWLGLYYLSATSVGLLGGIGMSQLIRVEPWEVWLMDAGAAAGLVLVGGGAYLIRSGLAPGPAGDILAGGAAGFGTIAGLAASAAAVAFFRVRRGQEFSRVGWLPVDLMFAPPAPVLDKEGNLTPLVPLVAGRF